MSSQADDLDGWIGELRARLARGELADLNPLTVNQCIPPVPGELLARIMLADLDHFDDLDFMRRRAGDVVARRLALLEDLRRLRARIG